MVSHGSAEVTWQLTTHEQFAVAIYMVYIYIPYTQYWYDILNQARVPKYKTIFRKTQIDFNPLTAGVAYIRVLIFISTLSTTFQTC